MRENLVSCAPMETLTIGTPYDNLTMSQKPPSVNISSNVYYGFHYHQTVQNNNKNEPEDLNKSFMDMDTGHYNNRKRTRDQMDGYFENVKKRRQSQNEPQTPTLQPPKLSPNKTHLEEALLRETHGCSYYHWVSSNN